MIFQNNLLKAEISQHSAFQQDNIDKLLALKTEEKIAYFHRLIASYYETKRELNAHLLKPSVSNVEKLNNEIFFELTKIHNEIIRLAELAQCKSRFEQLSSFLEKVDPSIHSLSDSLYIKIFLIFGGNRFFKETASHFLKTTPAKNYHYQKGDMLCSLLILFSKECTSQQQFRAIIEPLLNIISRGSLDIEFAYHFSSYLSEEKFRDFITTCPKELAIRFLNKAVFCQDEIIDKILLNRYFKDHNRYFLEFIYQCAFKTDRLTFMRLGKTIKTTNISDNMQSALISLINNPRFESLVLHIKEKTKIPTLEKIFLGFAEHNIVIPVTYFSNLDDDHVLSNPQFQCVLLKEYQKKSNMPIFLYQKVVDFYLSNPLFFDRISSLSNRRGEIYFPEFFNLFDKTDLARYFLPFIDNIVANKLLTNDENDLIEFRKRILSSFRSHYVESNLLKGFSDFKAVGDLTEKELTMLNFFLVYSSTSLNTNFTHSLIEDDSTIYNGGIIHWGLFTLYQKLKDTTLNKKEQEIFDRLNLFLNTILPELNSLFLNEYEDSFDYILESKKDIMGPSDDEQTEEDGDILFVKETIKSLMNNFIVE